MTTTAKKRNVKRHYHRKTCFSVPPLCRLSAKAQQLSGAKGSSFLNRRFMMGCSHVVLLLHLVSTEAKGLGWLVYSQGDHPSGMVGIDGDQWATIFSLRPHLSFLALQWSEGGGIPCRISGFRAGESERCDVISIITVHRILTATWEMSGEEMASLE